LTYKISLQGLTKLNTRLNILDIWVDPVDRYEAINRVEEFLQKGERPYTVFAANPEKNYSVPKDPTLYETFKNADLLLPDGIGIVLAARILFGVRLERIPGSEFIFDICRLAARNGCGIFIYGAKEEANKEAVNRLKKQFHDLKIAGRCNGYISKAEIPALINRINESRAEVLFLGLGSPKQEKWYSEYHRELKYIKVCQCIGGTLDTIAGNVKRAPEIWQKSSLEWLYRLIIQPRRIRRQKILPFFIFAIFKMKLRHLIERYLVKTLKTSL
jgi:N-acetylglucosaminyldiphosphoundecaprenol N-acetyl-beta-D-mannosaminyltransferase